MTSAFLLLLLGMSSSEKNGAGRSINDLMGEPQLQQQQQNGRRQATFVVQAFGVGPSFWNRPGQSAGTTSTPSSPVFLQGSEEDDTDDDETVLPSLTDWRVERDGTVTGTVRGHPVVPDGETLTTAPLGSASSGGGRGGAGSNSNARQGATIQTIKGTKYRLLEPRGRAAAGGGLFGGFGGGGNSKNRKGQEPQETVIANVPTGYYYSTKLPYEDQLAFLEELTETVRALQGQEIVQKQQQQQQRRQVQTVRSREC